jgi:hypothetical protein
MATLPELEARLEALRANDVASPRPGDQLTAGSDTFVIQGEPNRRDPDRLVWTLDVRRD